MRTHRGRRLLPVILGLLIVVPLAVAGVGAVAGHTPAPASRLLADGDRNVVPLDAELVAYDPETGGPAVVMAEHERTQHPNLAPVLLEDQRFEGDEYPPPGWQVLDLAADNDMVPPRYTWAIQTCSRQAFVGGTKAVWSVGGGSEGSTLSCLTAYPQGAKVLTVLGYPADLTDYPNGFQMQWSMNVDQPFPNALLFGAVDLDTGEEYWRAFTELTSTGGQWVPMQEPVPYPDFGGRSNVLIAFAYRDPLPTGAAGTGVNFGVTLDNIKIEGLPYEGPTDTPTPSITPTPRVTPTPTFTPQPPRQYAYMPLLFKDIDVDSLPRPEPPSGSGVEVRFGTGIDAVTGAIQNPGMQFDTGIAQLCARIRYWGQPLDTELRWQWYMNGDQISFAGLNDTVMLSKAEGFEYRCIASPPDASFEVRAYIDGAADPSATGSARVGP